MRFLDEIEEEIPRVKSRKKRIKGSWENCTWTPVLNDLTYRDPEHYNGKTFRRRFRVPFCIFEKMFAICQTAESFQNDGSLWFSRGEMDCCRKSTIPLSLLILGCLRILGRGMCMDGINKLTNISIEAHRVFFHQFCYLFSNRLFEIYCKPPTTEKEIATIMGEYAMLGIRVV